MSIGEKIQHLRKTHGLSQDQLSEQLDVSRQAISKWELNESFPDADKVLKLSGIFNVTTDYLLKTDVDSDEDLPVVKAAVTTTKKLCRDKIIRQAIVISAVIGIAGIAILLLLSTFIVSGKWVPIDVGNPVSENIQAEVADGSQTYYVFTRAAYGKLRPFLSTYHLEPIFVICCILILVSVVSLVIMCVKGDDSFHLPRRRS